MSSQVLNLLTGSSPPSTGSKGLLDLNASRSGRVPLVSLLAFTDVASWTILAYLQRTTDVTSGFTFVDVCVTKVGFYRN